MSENIQRLRELAELLDSGHINRAEFERAKRTVLSEEGEPSADELSAWTTQQVGPYQLKSLLGEGGMGRVFRARHTSQEVAQRQGGDVAFKLLHEQHRRSPKLCERFRQEAHLGIRLNHPGIARTLELWNDQNQLGLVMEYIQGRTLSEELRSSDRAWAWAEARPLLSQLMDAVAYAHAEGVIHRDLKPDNVIIQPDGVLKILDFGIAKSRDAQLTQTGLGLGTADYMAPEQYVSAKSVDGRADIYSLGIILYQMLAGRLPWASTPSIEAILHLKKSGNLPPPSRYLPSIPSELESMIMRMLAPEPEDRFADISELRATVAAVDHMVGQTILFEPPLDAKTATESKTGPAKESSNRILYASIALLVMIFIGLGSIGTYIYMNMDAGSRPERSDDSDKSADKEEADPPEPLAITSRDQLTTKIRRQYQIHIRTDDSDRVESLAQSLRGLGYKVRIQPSSVFNRQIRWEAAPEPIIEEILEMTIESTSTEESQFSLLGPRDGEDTKILLDLPFEDYR
jgi:serine/threonine protein kinase